MIPLGLTYAGDMFSEEQNEIIESAAEMLYGLIHVRYILTTKGLGVMVKIHSVNIEFVIYTFVKVNNRVNHPFDSLRNTRTQSLADARGSTAVVNPVFRLANQMFLDKVM